MKFEIQRLSNDSFGKYGLILDFEPTEDDICSNQGSYFRPVLSQSETLGWRIGKYFGKDRYIYQLESHPQTWESFEPISGVGILLVAEQNTPDNIEAFLLDRPVATRPGVWHWILSLSDIFEVKVTENYSVDTNFFKLEELIKAYVGR